MNNIKTTFSIKDLEHFTGIKAHTIRIWEKRYELLEPERTETNIRFYNLGHLQKLLNISFLNNNGYKISKIASLNKEEIHQHVRELSSKGHVKNHAINTFKMAMLDFDQDLFYSTYDSLAQTQSFKEIFYEVFIPFLSEIGTLWQTDTITPAHEHFVSALIRNKILVNTEKHQSQIKTENQDAFVLFLPDNEIHELGLMFVNYELVSRGHRAIYLGSSVPISSLVDVLSYYKKVTFISYFTVRPMLEDLEAYIAEFDAKLIRGRENRFYVLGQLAQQIEPQSLPDGFTIFNAIDQLIHTI